MDKEWESIRNDAFGLEPAKQALLVEELIHNLAHTPHMEAWLDESDRRIDAYHKGEIESIDLDDSLRRIERLIAE